MFCLERSCAAVRLSKLTLIAQRNVTAQPDTQPSESSNTETINPSNRTMAASLPKPRSLNLGMIW